MDELDYIPATRKTGDELFCDQAGDLSFDLLDFWQWCVSDLVSNVTRGSLAEYIVARALDIPTDGVRDEWAAYDLTTPEGVKVEVKSAAYIQRWYQKSLSRISFRVPKTEAWNAATNSREPISKRHADVYVFALLAHKTKSTLNPLNLTQWEFYVLPTKTLNERKRSQHSITLPSLKRLDAGPYTFPNLRDAVITAYQVVTR